MSALIAFCFTLLQTVLIVAAYTMHLEALFADVVIHGSPIVLITSFFGRDSVLNGPPLYLGFLAFHAIKYFCIFRARLTDDFPRLTLSSIFMEAAYLVLGAYYFY